MANYTQMIAKTLGIPQLEVSSICLAVALADGVYQWSFIQNETDDILVITYLLPDEENAERVAFINKKYIIDITPMDMEDLNKLGEIEEEETAMFG